MIEIAMCVCLALMGFYFIKSTDLPKDLKERSAQSRAEFRDNEVASSNPSRIVFPKEILLKTAVKDIEIDQQALLKETLQAERKIAEALELQKRLKNIEKRNEDIRQLNASIAKLEQELALNLERVGEIQTMIDAHKANLRSLQEKNIG